MSQEICWGKLEISVLFSTLALEIKFIKYVNLYGQSEGESLLSQRKVTITIQVSNRRRVLITWRGIGFIFTFGSGLQLVTEMDLHL